MLYVPHTEPTLIEENLTSLLERVEDLDGVAADLHIPRSKRDEIKRQYSSISQRRQQYCCYWLSDHPAPSWLAVADTLYRKRDHGALEVLQKFYLKGEHIHVPERKLEGSGISKISTYEFS